MSNPSFKKDGLVFWPIPEVSDVSLAFGLKESDYFNRRNLPNVPLKYEDKVNELFFKGGKLELSDDVPKEKAMRFLSAMLCSFRPSHESKTTTAAYALWCWSDECREAREKVKS